jgi:hypothetical protein
MADEIFGPLVTGSDVEQWTLATLQLWMPEYLAWTERRTGRTAHAIAAPAQWAVGATTDGWPTGTLPSVLVVSPGLVRWTRHDGARSIRGKYQLGVAVAVSAADRAAADRLARDYAGALRALMLQNPTLGGHVETLELVQEDYAPLTDAGGLARGTARVTFRVHVRGLASVGGGPKVPRADPYQPYPSSPLVELAELTVDAATD